jgi:hypothetical protein
VKQVLVVPENNITVKLEWERDILFHRVFLKVQYNLNGIIRTHGEEVSLISSGPDGEGPKLAEGVKQLSERVAREVTQDLSVQMMRKVLDSRTGGFEFRL